MTNNSITHDQACGTVEQTPIVRFYENYHVITIPVEGDAGHIWDAYSWIRERLGDYEVDGGWSASIDVMAGCMRFYIKDASEAMLFKLTWL